MRIFITLLIAFDILSVFAYLLWWFVTMMYEKSETRQYGWATFGAFLREYRKYDDWKAKDWATLKLYRENGGSTMWGYRYSITDCEIIFDEKQMLLYPISYIAFKLFIKDEFDRLQGYRKIKWE